MSYTLLKRVSIIQGTPMTWMFFVPYRDSSSQELSMIASSIVLMLAVVKWSIRRPFL